MSLNKVMLIGNVGNEPEVRYVDQGVAVGSLRIATTERGYKLQNGTEVPERTEWHSVVVWRRQAEYVERYVHKGDKLYIEGQLRTRSYDDRNGITRHVTEVWADRVEMLSPPRNGQSQGMATPAPYATQTAATPNPAPAGEDGIPF
ncbi:MAG: single-stranded DNA-binding protein [Bacteroidaceae bacterium]|nr:single-stranded DNA-binding protein [Bacteroidaceae bacterium]